MELIDGVKIIPLRQFPDYRGKVMKMISTLDAHYGSFGEIYFSVIHPGIIKGWHKHKSMQLNYACIQGKIQLVLVDGRARSPTLDMTMEIYLSPENYNLVHVPPLVFNAFKGLGTENSIVANCASLPYTPGEMERFPLSYIEYDWWKRGE